MKITKTLRSLFDEDRKQFEGSIGAAGSVEEAVNLARRKIDDLQNRFTGQLSVPQVRTAISYLNLLRSDLGMLAATNVQTVRAKHSGAHVAAQQLALQRQAWAPVGLTFVEALVGLGVLLAPWQISSWARVSLIVLLALIAGELAVQTASRLRYVRIVNLLLKALGWDMPALLASRSETCVNATPDEVCAVVRLDAKALVLGMDAAFELIDRTMIDTGEMSEAPAKTDSLENHRDVLKFFQELLAASMSGDANYTFKRAKALPALLGNHKIEPRLFDACPAGESAEMFDSEINLDSAEKRFLTDAPAFTSGKRVILKGRVLRPASGSGSATQK